MRLRDPSLPNSADEYTLIVPMLNLRHQAISLLGRPSTSSLPICRSRGESGLPSSEATGQYGRTAGRLQVPQTLFVLRSDRNSIPHRQQVRSSP